MRSRKRARMAIFRKMPNITPPRNVRARSKRRSATLRRSEEHTSELQSLMRISYAVFCLKKKKQNHPHKEQNSTNNTDNINNAPPQTQNHIYKIVTHICKECHL